MHILLFILYSLICGYGIVKLPFIRRSGIRPAILLALFFLHVFTGCLHNLIAWRYFPKHGDIWFHFDYSFILRHQLLTDFHAFLSDWTWSYLTHDSLMFIHILLNCLSFDDLYINTLLFSFPVFLGNIALFGVFRQRFPNDLVTAGIVFLLPSVLFWTSCIHREALLYMSLGFFLSGVHRLLAGVHSRPTGHRLLATGFRSPKFWFCLLWFAGLAFFRGAFALTLLPALFAWLWLELPQARRPLQWLAAAVIIAVVLVNLFAPGLTIPAIIAAKQREFYFLEAHSRIYLPMIGGTWLSLFQALPYIVLNGLFAPFPGAGGQPIYLAFALELILIWAIVLIALLYRAARTNFIRRPQPFQIFCLLLALTGMLIIGTTVPFVGAIVRYRSIYLPFLLAPFLHALRSLPPARSANLWLERYILLPPPNSPASHILPPAQ